MQTITLPISTRRRRATMGALTAAIALAAVFATPAIAQAQSFAPAAWPSKPVRIVVPYPSGSVTDNLARVLAKKMSDSLGQQFVVDNRGGANGNVGGAHVASSAPDGYTLMFSTTGPLSLNKLIYKSTPFDPVKDFAPVILFADVQLMITAHPSVPAKTVPELIAWLKANPGKISYATAGNGSMGHLSAELMQRATGTSMIHIPYKGSGPAITDVLGGVVPLSFDLVANYLQHVQAGKVRAIGMLSTTRSVALPDVPTLTELGIPVAAAGWFGMVAPAGTPAAVIDKLNGIANEFLASAEGRNRLRDLNLRPVGGKPADYAAFVAAELLKWKPVIDPLAASFE